ncbi:MAG: hypothetical protein IRY85_13195 [Micromonosporaceae bacterium]|nr:hypothetical protein [Micromonosporaceae bacterium]
MDFPASPLLRSLKCAWVQTPDLDQARTLCARAIGLSVLDSGAVETHWATTIRGARWVLFGDRDEDVGRLCLIEGVARPDAPGLPRGLDSVEIVVADVDRVAARVDAFPGTRRVGRTIEADLAELGGNRHRSALWRMPWGTHLIVTAGLTAVPGRQFPTTDKEAGRVFEVHVRTSRHADGLALYSGALGMHPLMSARFDRGPIHQAWGLPTGRPVAMDLLKTGPAGTGLGAVELQGHNADTLQADAQGGTVGLTFEAPDVALVHAGLRTAGYEPSPVTRIAAGPFAGRLGFTVSGVEGELLEVIEVDGAR